MLRLIYFAAIAAGVLMVFSFTAFHFSPWPTTLVLRRGWDRGGVATNNALQKYVPADVSAHLNIQYDTSDSDADLDVFYPSRVENTTEILPTIVWVHGGSWISGSKDYIANYLKILASRGFTTVGVNYTLAPTKTYPTPVEQVNIALGFVDKNAARLHTDSARLFLAGDSAGSQIAAQVANLISSPSYATALGIVPSIDISQLRGVIFHCGVFDAEITHFKRNGVLWSYFGTKDFLKDPKLSLFSVARHLTAAFPPTFISVGNSDALAPQSYNFAESATARGIPLDELFFPQQGPQKVPHEFQFDLETDAGRLALERSIEFITDRLR